MDHGLQLRAPPWGTGKVATQTVSATGRKLYILTAYLTGETTKEPYFTRVNPKNDEGETIKIYFFRITPSSYSFF